MLWLCDIFPLKIYCSSAVQSPLGSTELLWSLRFARAAQHSEQERRHRCSQGTAAWVFIWWHSVFCGLQIILKNSLAQTSNGYIFKEPISLIIKLSVLCALLQSDYVKTISGTCFQSFQTNSYFRKATVYSGLCLSIPRTLFINAC